jgi:translation initiation factor IF-2
LEAELLDLKADPGKRAMGVVIESTLEQGRGYVTTLLVEAGTLRKGDVLLVGQFSGRVRNMFNERGQAVLKPDPQRAGLHPRLGWRAQRGRPLLRDGG